MTEARIFGHAAKVTMSRGTPAGRTCIRRRLCRTAGKLPKNSRSDRPDREIYELLSSYIEVMVNLAMCKKYEDPSHDALTFAPFGCTGINPSGPFLRQMISATDGVVVNRNGAQGNLRFLR